MKKTSIFLLVAMAFSSCKNRTEKQEDLVTHTSEEFPVSYISAGEEFTADNILSSAEMQQRFRELKVGDTVEVKFKSTVNSVCKSKGCWMKLDLPKEEEVMVKFRDYGFFVPKDIEEKEVVVNGKAFVAEMSVEDQQHFAEDAGKSSGEIAAITEPKKTLSFVAEGVVIEDN
jgi:hypothetical protein